MRKLPLHHLMLHPPATLQTPQVSIKKNGDDPAFRLVLTRPQGYNSGRFILRFDCGFGGIPIELEYRSVRISSSRSDVAVRRSRSCFVVGEISRVTVWFVSGRQISSTPAVVNATSGEGKRRKSKVKFRSNHNYSLTIMNGNIQSHHFIFSLLHTFSTSKTPHRPLCCNNNGHPKVNLHHTKDNRSVLVCH